VTDSPKTPLASHTPTFADLFGDRFRKLFTRRRNRTAIDLALYDLVLYVGKGVPCPLHLDRQTLASDVWCIVKRKTADIPIDPAGNPASYFRTCAMRAWSDAVNDQRRQTRTLSPLPSGDTAELARLPQLPDSFSRMRRNKKILPPISKQDLRVVRSYLDKRIRNAADACRQANDPLLAAELDGILRGFQESRRYCVGAYLPVETPRLRFIAERYMGAE
jgi:hypothetical protein